MTLQELREKRTKVMHDLQALLLKDEKTTEDRASIDKMQAAMTEMAADLTRAEEIDAKIEAEKRAVIPRQEQPGSGAPTQASEERKAFENYIRFGAPVRIENRRMVEQRDLLTSGTGGAFVPQEFYPVLTEAKKAWGGILNIVKSQSTDSGAPMKLAFDTDVANVLHESGEPATITETDPTPSSATVTPLTLDTGVIKVSIQELQDSAFDIDSFIRDKFAKRYYRGLTAKVTLGSTASGIDSIITGAFDGHTSAAGAAISYADVVGTYNALDPAYRQNATWVMNSNTQGLLLAVTDTLGRPLYIPNPTTGAFDALLGHPVVLNQSMANVALNSRSLQFGDYSEGYLLRTVQPGLAIVRLNERFMDTLEVGFIGYCRIAGKVTDAGTHPIVNLLQAAA